MIMKKWLRVILAVCMVLGSVNALAFDYSPYEIRDRFPIDVYLLKDGEFVAETWEDRYGSLGNDWHVTWWKDGKIHREVDYEPNSRIRYWAAPHRDGNCGILETEAQKSSGGAAVTLYDWTEEGLTNPRHIADGVKEVRTAFGGFSIWKKEKKEIGIYDDAGNLLFEMTDAENMPIRLAFDQLGNAWFMTPVYGERYEDSTYILRQIRDGKIIWEKKLIYVVSVFPDAKGGIFTVGHLGTSTYKPIEIVEYDAAGNKTATKRMSADRVVLSCGMMAGPESDELILTGTAVANSRKVYKVYRMVVDAEDWTVKDMDVRAMDYYNDYNLQVARDLDGSCYSFAHGIDEYDTENINPVLVPFDMLDKTENPGIRIQ